MLSLVRAREGANTPTRWRKVVAVSVLLLAVGPPVALLWTNAGGAASGGGTVRAIAEVRFAEPVSDGEVNRLAGEYGVEVEVAQGEYRIGDEVHQEGFTGDNGTSLEEKRLGAFADMVASVKDLPEEERRELMPEFDVMKEALKTGDTGPASRSSVTFAGEESALQKLVREEGALISDANVLTIDRLLQDMQYPGPLEGEPEDSR